MILFICGKGGSGKDTLKKAIKERKPDFQEVIQYTTRPPRSYEVDGQDYHFLSLNDFMEKRHTGVIAESRAYPIVDSEVWRYGTPASILSGDDKYIMTGPYQQYLNLKDAAFGISGSCILGVYLDVTPYVCLERMLVRCTKEDDKGVVEACRRVFRDSVDYKKVDHSKFDLVLENKDLTVEEETKLVLSVLREWGE